MTASRLKVLVIGCGSIGQRHARLLTELGCQVAVVSHRSIDFVPHYFDLTQALFNWQPQYVVVANRTSEHCQTIESLVHHGFKGRLLVEKPILDRTSMFPDNNFSLSAVAYNLRCHPLLAKLKSLLDDSEREILINTNRHTIRVDLIKNMIAINGVEEFVTVARDDTYRAEHQAMLNGNIEGLCTLEEAMETLLTIEAAEKAAALKTWVER